MVLLGKDLTVNVLMDFYGELLTRKQLQVLDYYYNQDYSLTEIAEHMNITRQGVHDAIKRGEKQLLELEETLGVAERFATLNQELVRLDEVIGQIRGYNAARVLDGKIKELEEITKRMKDEI